jgi:hypothetical protein
MFTARLYLCCCLHVGDLKCVCFWDLFCSEGDGVLGSNTISAVNESEREPIPLHKVIPLSSLLWKRRVIAEDWIRTRVPAHALNPSPGTIVNQFGEVHCVEFLRIMLYHRKCGLTGGQK